MAVRVTSGLHMRKRQHLPGEAQRLGAAMPCRIQVARDRGNGHREVWIAKQHLAEDHFGRRGALLPVLRQLRAVPPAVAIDVAVEDAPARERCRVGLGQAVGGERLPEELERVDVPLAALGAFRCRQLEVSVRGIPSARPDGHQVGGAGGIAAAADDEIRPYAAVDLPDATKGRQHAGQPALEFEHPAILDADLPVVGNRRPLVVCCAVQASTRSDEGVPRASAFPSDPLALRCRRSPRTAFRCPWHDRPTPETRSDLPSPPIETR